MRPHHEDDRQVDEQARSALGVAPRCAGAAIARERAAAYQGFTAALPHAAAARRVLEEGGRQLGLRAGVVRTLATLLSLYRGWGLRRPPVLAATNAAIARAAGCDERTVQKHLAALRAQGLILVLVLALRAEVRRICPRGRAVRAHREASHECDADRAV